ncbi:MAG: hypothetical protein M3P93_10565, partial [Actinomycetota bacterium]|nr:hypothetical protein [Actinomycetota bacterium]
VLGPTCGFAHLVKRLNARPGSPLKVVLVGAADAAARASRAKRGCTAAANIMAASAQIVTFSEIGEGYVHVTHRQSRRGTIFINRTCTDTIGVSRYDRATGRTSLGRTWTAKYTC